VPTDAKLIDDVRVLRRFPKLTSLNYPSLTKNHHREKLPHVPNENVLVSCGRCLCGASVMESPTPPRQLSNGRRNRGLLKCCFVAGRVVASITRRRTETTQRKGSSRGFDPKVTVVLSPDKKRQRQSLRFTNQNDWAGGYGTVFVIHDCSFGQTR